MPVPRSLLLPALRYPALLYRVQRARVERARLAEDVVRVLAEIAEFDEVADDGLDVLVVHSGKELQEALVDLVHVGKHLLESFVVGTRVGLEGSDNSLIEHGKQLVGSGEVADELGGGFGCHDVFVGVGFDLYDPLRKFWLENT